MKLEDSCAFRWGSTQTGRDMEYATCDVWFVADNSSTKTHIRFAISAAGGGTTELLLAVGAKDWKAILPVLADQFPKELAAVLSESASIAINKVLNA